MDYNCTAGSALNGAVVKAYLYSGGRWIEKGSCTIGRWGCCGFTITTPPMSSATWEVRVSVPDGWGPCGWGIWQIVPPGYGIGEYIIRWDNIPPGSYYRCYKNQFHFGSGRNP